MFFIEPGSLQQPSTWRIKASKSALFDPFLLRGIGATCACRAPGLGGRALSNSGVDGGRFGPGPCQRVLWLSRFLPEATSQKSARVSWLQ